MKKYLKAWTEDEELDDEDFEEDDFEEDEELDWDAFYPIEEEVCSELGIYLDTSSVRFDDGTVFIFSDPDQENNADIWMGDPDDELGQLDFYEYKDEVYNIMQKPESKWKSSFKEFIERFI